MCPRKASEQTTNWTSNNPDLRSGTLPPARRFDDNKRMNFAIHSRMTLLTAILIAGFAPHSATAAETEIDPSLCTAGLPGYNAVVLLKKDGRLAFETSPGYFEKRDTSVRNVTEYHFQTRNKVIRDDSNGEKTAHPMIRTRVLAEETSRDVLIVARDAEGRVQDVRARSLDGDIKARGLILTEMGWKPAAREHTIGLRYQNGRCLKTHQFEVGPSGKQHIVYSESHCETLFPAIEKIENSQGDADTTRLVTLFKKMEKESEDLARKIKSPTPTLGAPDEREAKLSISERALHFARRCVMERNDFATWRALRTEQSASASTDKSSPNDDAKRPAKRAD